MIKVSTLTLIVSLSVLALSVSVYGQGGFCSKIEALRDGVIRTTNPKSVSERAQRQMEQWSFIKELSELIYQKYFDETLQLNFINECIIDQREQTLLNNTLADLFLQKSLLKIEKSQSKQIQMFSQLVSRTINSRNIIPFKFIGHMKSELNKTDMKGGFHRGTRSIFMDITLIPPNEWIIVLVHEFAHSIDPFLKEAVANFSDPEMGKLIIQWNNSTTNPSQLSSEDHKKLYNWIKAGLDRGLVAEYRAWTLTFQIYLEGLKERIWKPVSWMDEVLSIKQSNESLADFLYNFLENRFVDPQDLEGLDKIQNRILLLPLIKNTITDIRREYLKSKPKLIPLY